jgi:2-polyprenyl-6-methoxyphenol hydroxylase-like FAD-dependent oxidoreductase
MAIDRSAARRGEAKAFECALVMGGSLEGLLAARVLAEHAHRVVIVERDALDGEAARKGTPQARHANLLDDRTRLLRPGLAWRVLLRGGMAVERRGARPPSASRSAQREEAN